MNIRRFSMCAALLLIASPAWAKPTPVPGGANQARAVEGTLKDTLFNGQARLRQMKLGKPDGSASESYADTADQTWIVFRALASNGTPKPLDMQQFSASIVDADGVAVAAQPDKVRPIGSVNGIPPGGAWREVVLFNVPKGFKPAKIVLVPTGSSYKAFRITVTPADVP
jgi:hypothetical protein